MKKKRNSSKSCEAGEQDLVKEANTVYPPSVMKKKKNKTIERKAFLLAWLIAWSAGLLWLACESSYQKLFANRIVHLCEKYKRNDYFVQIKKEKNMVTMNTLLLNPIHGSETRRGAA